MAGGVVFNAVYGYHVQTNDDPLIHAAEDMMKVTTYAFESGWLIDFLTFCE